MADFDDMTIDPKEAKLLGDILALVVNDQPGQANAALAKLCRRAQRDRITGGAIKAVFERIISGDLEMSRPTGLFSEGEDTERLKDLIRRLQKEDEETRAILELEQATHAELRTECHRFRRRMAILAPAAVLAAALTGFFIGLSHADKDLAPVQVDPASTVLPDALQPDIKLPPGAQKMPADTAVLPAEIRQQIADHFRDCHLLSAASGHDNDMHPVRIVLEIDAQSIIRIARVSPTDGQSIADPVFKAFAGQIGHKLVSADCATLPIPAYLHGRVKTVSLTLNVGVR